MKEKKTIICLSIVCVAGLLICFGFVLAANNQTSNKLEDKSSNNVKEQIFETNTEANVETKNEEKSNDEVMDFSNYKVDSKYEIELEYLANNFALSEANKNIMLESTNRLEYTNYVIMKSGNYQLTTDSAQQSAYVTKEFYAEQFNKCFGSNYSYESTVQNVEAMWYSDCNLYPSVYDGKHICFTTVSSPHAPTYFVDLVEKNENGFLKVSGTYHIGNTIDYHKVGTFEIDYDVSKSNRTLLGIRYAPSE